MKADHAIAAVLSDTKGSEMNTYRSIPDFDELIRRLVEKEGFERVALRVDRSVRAVQFWIVRKHLPAVTKAPELAARLGRSAAYITTSLMQARSRADTDRRRGAK